MVTGVAPSLPCAVVRYGFDRMELRQLLAEEEAAKAAERVRRTAAQARIAELQALTRHQ